MGGSKYIAQEEIHVITQPFRKWVYDGATLENSFQRRLPLYPIIKLLQFFTQGARGDDHKDWAPGLGEFIEKPATKEESNDPQKI